MPIMTLDVDREAGQLAHRKAVPNTEVRSQSDRPHGVECANTKQPAQPSVHDMLAQLDPSVDWVLVEGFQDGELPIESGVSSRTGWNKGKEAWSRCLRTTLGCWPPSLVLQWLLAHSILAIQEPKERQQQCKHTTPRKAAFKPLTRPCRSAGPCPAPCRRTAGGTPSMPMAACAAGAVLAAAGVPPPASGQLGHGRTAAAQSRGRARAGQWISPWRAEDITQGATGDRGRHPPQRRPTWVWPPAWAFGPPAGGTQADEWPDNASGQASTTATASSCVHCCLRMGWRGDGSGHCSLTIARPTIAALADAAMDHDVIVPPAAASPWARKTISSLPCRNWGSGSLADQHPPASLCLRPRQSRVRHRLCAFHRAARQPGLAACHLPGAGCAPSCCAAGR
ncbi:hypothetical protein FQR65_LT20542 [Abscondita terminalis]|nr:hypothetical protein FQR65_LT20542 [Abscondita terminalis]